MFSLVMFGIVLGFTLIFGGLFAIGYMVWKYRP